MKKLLLLFAFPLAMNCVWAQSLQIQFDYSNAEKTLEYIRSKDTNAIREMLTLEATQALLKKIGMSESEGRQSLLAVRDTEAYKDNYQLSYIIHHDKDLENFVAEIKTQESIILNDIKEALDSYLPETDDLSVTVHFLLGGYSSGFTFNDMHHFYIGLHHYHNDLNSLKNTCIHELFHNIQRAYYDSDATTGRLEEADPGLTYVHYMLANIFKEGTASFVADLNKLNGDTPHIRELKEHASINNYRLQDIFYMISRLLVDAGAHPDQVQFQNLYSILMDWNWNNPGYYAGYSMMQALAGEGDGQEKLLEYIRIDPVYFFYDYIRLSDQKEELPKFSTQFEELLLRLMEKIEAP